MKIKLPKIRKFIEISNSLQIRDHKINPKYLLVRNKRKIKNEFVNTILHTYGTTKR